MYILKLYITLVFYQFNKVLSLTQITIASLATLSILFMHIVHLILPVNDRFKKQQTLFETSIDKSQRKIITLQKSTIIMKIKNSHGCLLLIYKQVVLGASIDEVFSEFKTRNQSNKKKYTSTCFMRINILLWSKCRKSISYICKWFVSTSGFQSSNLKFHTFFRQFTFTLCL